MMNIKRNALIGLAASAVVASRNIFGPLRHPFAEQYIDGDGQQ